MQKARKICLQQKPSESGYQRIKARAFPIPLRWFPLRCENQSQGFGNKSFSKGKRRGATCSIRWGTFANHAEGTELQSIRCLLSGSVQSAKQFQNLETSSRSPKGDETCETIMDTAEPGISADTEKPTTSSSYEQLDKSNKAITAPKLSLHI